MNHSNNKRKINRSRVCHNQKMNDATTHKIDKVPMKQKSLHLTTIESWSSKIIAQLLTTNI